MVWLRNTLNTLPPHFTLPVSRKVTVEKTVALRSCREQRYVPCSFACSWFSTTDGSSVTTRVWKLLSSSWHRKMVRMNSVVHETYASGFPVKESFEYCLLLAKTKAFFPGVWAEWVLTCVAPGGPGAQLKWYSGLPWSKLCQGRKQFNTAWPPSSASKQCSETKMAACL